MIQVHIKNTPDLRTVSKSEFEELMQIRWLDSLEFPSDPIIKKVLKRSKAAMKKKELSIRENWIGIHFYKEISDGFMPPVSIRWINDQIGYGVFAEKDIPTGAYIGEYTGTIRKRRRRADRSNDYCFEYTIGDWIYNPFIIDAKDQGNFTRYINHSQVPNLDSLSIFADEVMHIVLVANQPIKKGAELCYHYGDTFWKKRSKNLSPQGDS